MKEEGFIKVRGLRKDYGGVVAVENLDLSIARGDIVTLLGPSGCGKTTTLRCIAGLETPTAGVITIAGLEVDREGHHAPPRERNIGMVFQGFALWPHMRVRDNVAFPLRRKGLPKAQVLSRTESVLSMVGLSGRAHHFPGELSGGQQQRVALARALVGEPKVILYDEPLSSLDAKLRAQIRQEIRELHKRLEITAVYVTHDQEEAIDISDHVHVMQDGKIVQGGAPIELSDNPRSLFVCEFFGRSNVFAIDEFRALHDGLYEVKTKDGLVLLSQAIPDSTSRPAFVAVRPHRITLAAFEGASHSGGAMGRNALQGEIASVRNYGTRVAYVVTLPGGGKLDVEAVRTKSPFGDGAKIIATFDASDCMLLT